MLSNPAVIPRGGHFQDNEQGQVYAPTYLFNNSYPQATNAYIASVPASTPYNPYFAAPGQLVPTILGPDPSSAPATAVSQQIGPCVPQPVPIPQQHKLPQHTDRIEVSWEFLRGF